MPDVFTLREYQTHAVEELRAKFRAGTKRIVLVSPTGSGKTVIASHIIEAAVAKGSRVLFLAHRRELIDQCSKKLDRLGVPHGIIMADHPRTDIDQSVQVASVQTLIRRDDQPLADLIVVDEAHRSISTSYLNILANYPEARVLGMTATPWRTDGRGLGIIYESMIVVESVKNLIAGGFLVRSVIYAPERPDLSNARIRAGDYDSEDIEKIMNTTRLVGNVVEHWHRLARMKRTVVFAVSVAHSIALRNRFMASGIDAEHIDARTPPKARDATLQRLRTGETKIVCNVGILTEGWDLPELECVLLARPTKSSVLYLQEVGRGMRAYEGKDHALILDHAGCVYEHGFPEEDREYTLDDQSAKSPGKKKPPKDQAKICPECFAAVATTAVECPECGEDLRSDDNQPNETGDDLKQITSDGTFACEECGSIRQEQERIPIAPFKVYCTCGDCGHGFWALDRVMAKRATKKQKIDEFAKLERVRRQKGYKPDWSSHRYRDLFGVWPRGVKSGH